MLKGSSGWVGPRFHAAHHMSQIALEVLELLFIAKFDLYSMDTNHGHRVSNLDFVDGVHMRCV